MQLFNRLLKKTKHIIVTLRFSLLSIFSALFLLTMLLLLSIFYMHLSKVIVRAALLLMDRTSYSVLYNLDSELRPVETASQFSANNIREGIVNVNNTPQITAYLIHLLTKLNLAQGAYWADMQGNFLYLSKEADHTFRAEFINKLSNQTLKIDLDGKHQEIKREIAPLTYDPRTHVWFKLALAKKRTVWTDVYPYRHENNFLGATVASPVFDATGNPLGVFGIDVTLDYLSQYLSQQKVGQQGQIFILDRNGKVLIAPLGKSSISREMLTEAFNLYRQSNDALFQFSLNDQFYLATFRPIPILTDNDWIIAIIDVASDYTNEVHSIEFFYTLIVCVIFLVGMLIISNLITRIVTPIRKLVRETEKIKNFELEGHVKINSHIREVIELSNAIDGMKKGLRSFKRYVPASLVRQLIRTGEDEVVGGARRKLAIFFSDIQNFTTIAEKSDYVLLVKELSEYFEMFSQVIRQHEGTIDKYIGDAIMAFWGAPLANDASCQAAASTALQCLDQLKALTAKWTGEGLPPFLTRFGIHYGDVIVGSIGSSERLNYTAIGDNVNIAARLVAANKIYNTSILVSESVYLQIKDSFVLRFVDKVILKGKIESIAIYELLGFGKQSMLFDIDRYRLEFEKGFKAYQTQMWQEAIQHFLVCVDIYPEDRLAFIFIERCKYFAAIPPLEWNGVWHISEK